MSSEFLCLEVGQVFLHSKFDRLDMEEKALSTFPLSLQV